MSVGVLIGMSITQGGNGLPVFHPAVYHYMVTGSYLNVDVATPDIPDAGVCFLVEKVIIFHFSERRRFMYSLVPRLHSSCMQ